MKYLNTIFLLFMSIALMAQTSFTNNTVALGLDGYHSGVAIAIADVNGDGLDDIAHLAQGKDLYIEYQQTDGSFVQVYAGNMSNSSEWNICMGDVDNNGITDVTTGGSYNGVKLALANNDGSNFSISTLPGASLFVQGSNFVDINNDGWLDHFACHDDAESRIWGNDGTGNLIQQDSWIDMSTPGSDNSGNYGSVWCDFDYDGDLDLYIAKCRQGVNDSNDPRRINVLYENDGNGNYTENADAYGLKIGAQSWTADFADYDNDGDFDCFITNHDVPSQLLRNDDGYFNDVTATSGIDINIIPVQGIMEDFDNDGYVDLLVSGGDGRFFHNDGDGTFTEMDLFDNENMESFAIGDLNHDGFLDIYAGYANIYTSPTSVDDAIWLNDGNSNNFVAVNLEGVVSNKSAVGAKVELHGAWGVQVREVRAGESYGIVNSFSQHFGIGQNTTVDQIVVKWPSGLVNVVDDPAINQYITIIENNCTAPIASITTAGDPVLCTGSTLDLTGPTGYSYEWSDGSTTQTITVSQGGMYGLTITDGAGCSGSTSVNIEVDPIEVPTLTVDGNLPFCQGGSVTLTSSPSSAYTWSNGSTDQSITVTEAGTYNVTTQGICDQFTSSSIDVDVLTAPAPIADDAYVEGPQSITLSATGNDMTWYDAAMGGSIVGSGASYTTPVLNDDTSYFIEDSYKYGGGNFDAGMLEHSGGSNYSGSQYNGQVIFDALTEFTLNTVKVYTETPGIRIIELRDDSGAVIESATVNINGPIDIITLGFNIMPGTDYVLTTNGANNNTLFGDNSPELKRNSSNVSYPYTIADVIDITGSDQGAQYYYYFYEWDVELPSEVCISDRTEVFVNYIDVTSITDIDGTNDIKMYPNPSNGWVNLDMVISEKSDVSIAVYDISGKQVRNVSIGNLHGETNEGIDLSSLAKGVYTIKITAGKHVYAGKVVLQ